MLEEVEREIEELRMEMYQAYKNKLTYEEVLEISQKLDQWLNAWNDLKLSEEVSLILKRG